MYPSLETIICRILDQHVGEANAISWAIFCEEVNCHSHDPIQPWEVRDAIHGLRQAANLICSSPKGYYRPATLNEGLEYVNRTYRKPAKDELITARIQREALRQYFGGQLALSFDQTD
jgi:hypothetical protein